MVHPLAALLGVVWLGAAPTPAPTPTAPAPTVQPGFLFDIATASGSSESTWAGLAYDRKHDELFVTFGGLVHVFNPAAMETFTFGGDGNLGAVERVAVLESGELLLLCSPGNRRVVYRADYRGELLGPFQVKGLPPALARFEPDRVLVQGEKVYLVDTAAMQVVVTDGVGQVAQVHDLARAVLAQDPELKLGMSGFFVDAEGRLYFTMPFAFTAFVMDPDRTLRRFGTRGSSPGRFNIVGAIAADEGGTVFVLDRLRSVVMVFDPSLRFVQEFGYRGDDPTNLIAPYDLAVGNGKIFASQARERGVKVFRYQPLPRPAAPAQGGHGG